MKLTKATIERLKLPEDRRELIVFDEGLPGFGLRVRAGGKRTWIAQYRLGLKQRRVTLGTVETVDPDEARKRARSALSKVQLGTDPQLEKAEARAQAAVTLGSVVDNYLVRYAAKRLKSGTFTDVERYLRRHWAPLSGLPVRKITRADIATRLARIADDSGGFAANRARATLSALYAWAIAEGVTDANPVVGTRMPVDEIARDRVLSDDELAAIWQCARGGDYSAIVRLLILTGQRREEVAAMTWHEVDLTNAIWRISDDRTKNGRPHEVPLASQAVAILQDIHRREGRSLVFGSRGGPFSGWSKAKASLDDELSSALNRKPALWRLHDIRRTVATRIADDLGVPPHVVEAILNHVSGHKAGVAGVYNRATYASEKRQALELWGKRVASLAQGGAARIATLAAHTD
jgi:integrase